MTRKSRRALAVSTLLLSVAVAGGCAADPDRSGSPPPPSPPPPSPLATTVMAAAVSDLDVPDGFEPLSVEFAGRQRGYALFVRCDGKRCQARLFTTDNGGQAWRQRAHPRPEAENHQIYAGGGQIVVLLAEPHGWYVSRDGAGTWQQRPYDPRGDAPAEYHSANGQFYLDCPQEGARCAIRDWTAGQWRLEVPAGLDKVRSLTNGRDGSLWLAGVDGGRVVTAHGQGPGALTRLTAPAQPGSGAIFNARVATSADGADIWLIAEREPAGGQGGGRASALRHARKATGLPLIWQYQSGSWVPRPVTGIEERPTLPYAVAPAGGGLLAITGPGVAGYLDGGAYRPASNGPRLEWVGQLPDGSLFGKDNQPGVTYLSSGTGSRREWTTVEVRASAR